MSSKLQISRNSQISSTLVAECRGRLIAARREILDRVRSARSEYELIDRSGGDDADLTMSLQAEHAFLTIHQRLREHLLEIDAALSRIERGQFGICEETDEPIEPERLRSMPWTRLSIEGAELREALARRHSR